ncbi:hypothetical protein [Maridesulfovibrio sp.]|uniref:hypothetical protein n=1 Tax=Maridesulfovibrio sp. TaxID=2795000 RepID=UPI003BAD2BF5
MKKKLIEAGNLDSFICPDCHTFFADCNMILTPGAKDELSKRKIKLARVEDAAAAVAGCCNGAADNVGCGNSDCTKEACNGCEELVMGIAVLLKEEYGITDLAQLKEMSFKLADAVKGNI